MPESVQGPHFPGHSLQRPAGWVLGTAKEGPGLRWLLPVRPSRQRAGGPEACAQRHFLTFRSPSPHPPPETKGANTPGGSERRSLKSGEPGKLRPAAPLRAPSREGCSLPRIVGPGGVDSSREGPERRVLGAQEAPGSGLVPHGARSWESQLVSYSRPFSLEKLG